MHGVRMCSVDQIIEYRLAEEHWFRDSRAHRTVVGPEGPFDLVAPSAIDPLPHLALTPVALVCPMPMDIPKIDDPVLVRMHRRDVLGDVFGATGRPGQDAVRSSAAFREEGRGAQYLRPESMGGGIGDLLHGLQRGG